MSFLFRQLVCVLALAKRLATCQLVSQGAIFFNMFDGAEGLKAVQHEIELLGIKFLLAVWLIHVYSSSFICIIEFGWSDLQRA